MFTVSILAAPSRADLRQARIDALRSRWNAGGTRWLDTGIAAEFAVQSAPADFWEAWAQLQAEGFDLAIQTSEGRAKSVLIADMDSTMINQECIDELADFAGVGARVAAITARAMNGELNFDEALNERVGLLAGLSRSVVDEVLASRITLAAGGPALLATMRAKGAYSALVSGGFTVFTGPIAAKLGFDENRANVLYAKDGILTGEVARPILGSAAKVEALREITDRLGLGVEQAIAVGDGANDLAMIQLAGAGVALHAKPSVAAQAKLRVNHGDLTALLYLQGYHREEFAS
ncbi:phosphoserine phosphatase SerB [Paracoccus cavernae]|uniref:phosphoserine phosphatase SerB n=1 Tax=Paracoccus cavernae TaxID=1571207 RepID=UPI00364092E2